MESFMGRAFYPGMAATGSKPLETSAPLTSQYPHGSSTSGRAITTVAPAAPPMPYLPNTSPTYAPPSHSLNPPRGGLSYPPQTSKSYSSRSQANLYSAVGHSPLPHSYGPTHSRPPDLERIKGRPLEVTRVGPPHTFGALEGGQTITSRPNIAQSVVSSAASRSLSDPHHLTFSRGSSSGVAARQPSPAQGGLAPSSSKPSLHHHPKLIKAEEPTKLSDAHFPQGPVITPPSHPRVKESSGRRFETATAPVPYSVAKRSQDPYLAESLEESFTRIKRIENPAHALTDETLEVSGSWAAAPSLSGEVEIRRHRNEAYGAAFVSTPNSAIATDFTYMNGVRKAPPTSSRDTGKGTNDDGKLELVLDLSVKTGSPRNSTHSHSLYPSQEESKGSAAHAQAAGEGSYTYPKVLRMTPPQFGQLTSQDLNGLPSSSRYPSAVKRPADNSLSWEQLPLKSPKLEPHPSGRSKSPYGASASAHYGRESLTKATRHSGALDPGRGIDSSYDASIKRESPAHSYPTTGSDRLSPYSARMQTDSYKQWPYFYKSKSHHGLVPKTDRSSAYVSPPVLEAQPDLLAAPYSLKVHHTQENRYPPDTVSTGINPTVHSSLSYNAVDYLSNPNRTSKLSRLSDVDYYSQHPSLTTPHNRSTEGKSASLERIARDCAPGKTEDLNFYPPTSVSSASTYALNAAASKASLYPMSYLSNAPPPSVGYILQNLKGSTYESRKVLEARLNERQTTKVSESISESFKKVLDFKLNRDMSAIDPNQKNLFEKTHPENFTGEFDCRKEPKQFAPSVSLAGVNDEKLVVPKDSSSSAVYPESKFRTNANDPTRKSVKIYPKSGTPLDTRDAKLFSSSPAVDKSTKEDCPKQQTLTVKHSSSDQKDVDESPRLVRTNKLDNEDTRKEGYCELQIKVECLPDVNQEKIPVANSNSDKKSKVDETSPTSAPATEEKLLHPPVCLANINKELPDAAAKSPLSVVNTPQKTNADIEAVDMTKTLRPSLETNIASISAVDSTVDNGSTYKNDRPLESTSTWKNTTSPNSEGPSKPVLKPKTEFISDDLTSVKQESPKEQGTDLGETSEEKKPLTICDKEALSLHSPQKVELKESEDYNHKDTGKNNSMQLSTNLENAIHKSETDYSLEPIYSKVSGGSPRHSEATVDLSRPIKIPGSKQLTLDNAADNGKNIKKILNAEEIITSDLDASSEGMKEKLDNDNSSQKKFSPSLESTSDPPQESFQQTKQEPLNQPDSPPHSNLVAGGGPIENSDSNLLPPNSHIPIKSDVTFHSKENISKDSISENTETSDQCRNTSEITKSEPLENAKLLNLEDTNSEEDLAPKELSEIDQTLSKNKSADATSSRNEIVSISQIKCASTSHQSDLSLEKVDNCVTEKSCSSPTNATLKMNSNVDVKPDIKKEPKYLSDIKNRGSSSPNIFKERLLQMVVHSQENNRKREDENSLQTDDLSSSKDKTLSQDVSLKVVTLIEGQGESIGSTEKKVQHHKIDSDTMHDTHTKENKESQGSFSKRNSCLSLDQDTATLVPLSAKDLSCTQVKTDPSFLHRDPSSSSVSEEETNNELLDFSCFKKPRNDRAGTPKMTEIIPEKAALDISTVPLHLSVKPSSSPWHPRAPYSISQSYNATQDEYSIHQKLNPGYVSHTIASRKDQKEEDKVVDSTYSQPPAQAYHPSQSLKTTSKPVQPSHLPPPHSFHDLHLSSRSPFASRPHSVPPRAAHSVPPLSHSAPPHPGSISLSHPRHKSPAASSALPSSQNLTPAEEKSQSESIRNIHSPHSPTHPPPPSEASFHTRIHALTSQPLTLPSTYNFSQSTVTSQTKASITQAWASQTIPYSVHSIQRQMVADNTPFGIHNDPMAHSQQTTYQKSQQTAYTKHESSSQKPTPSYTSSQPYYPTSTTSYNTSPSQFDSYNYNYSNMMPKYQNAMSSQVPPYQFPPSHYPSYSSTTNHSGELSPYQQPPQHVKKEYLSTKYTPPSSYQNLPASSYPPSTYPLSSTSSVISSPSPLSVSYGSYYPPACYPSSTYSSSSSFSSSSVQATSAPPQTCKSSSVPGTTRLCDPSVLSTSITYSSNYHNTQQSYPSATLAALDTAYMEKGSYTKSQSSSSTKTLPKASAPHEEIKSQAQLNYAPFQSNLSSHQQTQAQTTSTYPSSFPSPTSPRPSCSPTAHSGAHFHSARNTSHPTRYPSPSANRDHSQISSNHMANDAHVPINLSSHSHKKAVQAEQHKSSPSFQQPPQSPLHSAKSPVPVSHSIKSTSLSGHYPITTLTSNTYHAKTASNSSYLGKTGSSNPYPVLASASSSKAQVPNMYPAKSPVPGSIQCSKSAVPTLPHSSKSSVQTSSGTFPTKSSSYPYPPQKGPLLPYTTKATFTTAPNSTRASVSSYANDVSKSQVASGNYSHQSSYYPEYNQGFYQNEPQSGIEPPNAKRGKVEAHPSYDSQKDSYPRSDMMAQQQQPFHATTLASHLSHSASYSNYMAPNHSFLGHYSKPTTQPNYSPSHDAPPGRPEVTSTNFSSQVAQSRKHYNKAIEQTLSSRQSQSHPMTTASHQPPILSHTISTNQYSMPCHSSSSLHPPLPFSHSSKSNQPPTSTHPPIHHLTPPPSTTHHPPPPSTHHPPPPSTHHPPPPSTQHPPPPSTHHPPPPSTHHPPPPSTHHPPPPSTHHPPPPSTHHPPPPSTHHPPPPSTHHPPPPSTHHPPPPSTHHPPPSSTHHPPPSSTHHPPPPSTHHPPPPSTHHPPPPSTHHPPPPSTHHPPPPSTHHPPPPSTHHPPPPSTHPLPPPSHYLSPSSHQGASTKHSYSHLTHTSSHSQSLNPPSHPPPAHHSISKGSSSHSNSSAQFAYSHTQTDTHSSQSYQPLYQNYPVPQPAHTTTQPLQFSHSQITSPNASHNPHFTYQHTSTTYSSSHSSYQSQRSPGLTAAKSPPYYPSTSKLPTQPAHSVPTRNYISNPPGTQTSLHSTPYGTRLPQQPAHSTSHMSNQPYQQHTLSMSHSSQYSNPPHAHSIYASFNPPHINSSYNNNYGNYPMASKPEVLNDGKTKTFTPLPRKQPLKESGQFLQQVQPSNLAITTHKVYPTHSPALATNKVSLETTTTCSLSEVKLEPQQHSFTTKDPSTEPGKAALVEKLQRKLVKKESLDKADEEIRIATATGTSGALIRSSTVETKVKTSVGDSAVEMEHDELDQQFDKLLDDLALHKDAVTSKKSRILGRRYHQKVLLQNAVDNNEVMVPETFLAEEEEDDDESDREEPVKKFRGKFRSIKDKAVERLILTYASHSDESATEMIPDEDASDFEEQLIKEIEAKSRKGKARAKTSKHHYRTSSAESTKREKSDLSRKRSVGSSNSKEKHKELRDEDFSPSSSYNSSSSSEGGTTSHSSSDEDESPLSSSASTSSFRSNCRATSKRKKPSVTKRRPCGRTRSSSSSTNSNSSTNSDDDEFFPKRKTRGSKKLSSDDSFSPDRQRKKGKNRRKHSLRTGTPGKRKLRKRQKQEEEKAPRKKKRIKENSDSEENSEGHRGRTKDRHKKERLKIKLVNKRAMSSSDDEDESNRRCKILMTKTQQPVISDSDDISPVPPKKSVKKSKLPKILETESDEPTDVKTSANKMKEDDIPPELSSSEENKLQEIKPISLNSAELLLMNPNDSVLQKLNKIRDEELNREDVVEMSTWRETANSEVLKLLEDLHQETKWRHSWHKPSFGSDEFRKGWQAEVKKFKTEIVRIPKRLVTTPPPLRAISPTQAEIKGSGSSNTPKKGKEGGTKRTSKNKGSPAKNTRSRSGIVKTSMSSAETESPHKVPARPEISNVMERFFEKVLGQPLSPLESTAAGRKLLPAFAPFSPSTRSPTGLTPTPSLALSLRASDDSDRDSLVSLRTDLPASDSVPVAPRRTSIASSLIKKLRKKYRARRVDTQWLTKTRGVMEPTNRSQLLPTPGLSPSEENCMKEDLKAASPTARIISRKDSVSRYPESITNVLLRNGLNEIPPVLVSSRTRRKAKALLDAATIRAVFGEDPLPTTVPRSKPLKGSSSKIKGISSTIGAGTLPKKSAILQEVRRKEGLVSGALTAASGVVHTHSPVPSSVSQSSTPVDFLFQDDDDSEIRSERSETTLQELVIMQGIRKSRKKLRKFRKFRSGFDYIRKKKKAKPEEELLQTSKRKTAVRKRMLWPEESGDVANEVRGWVNNKGLGQTVLHKAARLQYHDVVVYCLENSDFNVNAKDNAGYTPLHEACNKGHLDIAQVLCAHHAHVNASGSGGMRPLHEAIENGHIELARLLLAYGADPSLSTYAGQSCLDLASDLQTERFVKQFLSDLRGKPVVPWHIHGPAQFFDPPEQGSDIFATGPTCYPETKNVTPCPSVTTSPEKPKLVPISSDLKSSKQNNAVSLVDPPNSPPSLVFESSDCMLPTIYVVGGREGQYLIMRDLLDHLSLTRKELILAAGSIETLLLAPGDFDKKLKCLVIGYKVTRKFDPKSSVSLVKYSPRIQQLLGIERDLVECRVIEGE